MTTYRVLKQAVLWWMLKKKKGNSNTSEIGQAGCSYSIAFHFGQESYTATRLFQNLTTQINYQVQ